MVFHWSLCDSKSPQVSRTLLSILAVLDNVVVWMVSTRPPTSKFSSTLNNPLFTVPNAPITIDMIVTCMFHSFLNFIARSKYLSFFSHFFSFILWSAGRAKSTISQVLPFLLIIIRPGLLAEIRRSVCTSKSQRGLCLIVIKSGLLAVCMLKSHRGLCVAFPKTGTGLCIIIIIPLEFFKSALTDGFSLKFE